ncbi:DNA cytosine methyltransferase [Tsuneonella sp. HG222]
MVRQFYEFFAGAGMARAGLGEDWECLFANDIDLKKAVTYEENWQTEVMKAADVKTLKTTDLPGSPELVWASFPCQDLSLAGGGAGLKGERSGVFWPFWRLMEALIKDDRAPAIIALENVPATLTSHDGRDFEELCLALVNAGYNVGARVVDAALFVPQSRPRMFLIGVRNDILVPAQLKERAGLTDIDTRVSAAYARMKERAAEEPKLKPVIEAWIDWSLAAPNVTRKSLEELLEVDPVDVEWHSEAETKTLIDRMSEINRKKVKKARDAGVKMYGTAYRRTRVTKGVKTVRTEVRFDGIAGCLRTPSGGSSRQIVIEVKGRKTRSRLMTPREAARLMGMDEGYKLPDAYNEAYHLIGDGVAVPVVAYLRDQLFDPLLVQLAAQTKKAA